MHLINLYAFLLPLVLFTFCSLVGMSTLLLLYPQKNMLRSILVAPSVGLSITTVLVFLLNWLGMPVKQYAVFLTIILFIYSLSVLIIKKPDIEYKKALPFVVPILIALILVGRPLLSYGFNWISFGNDDMTNYCLGAMRFMNHGYFAIPSVMSMQHWQDYSLYTWFFYVLDMSRPGSELILAWLASTLNLLPLQIFMPVIITFLLILVITTGALVYYEFEKTSLAIVGSMIAAVSALTALGAVYQLIAQVAGLPVLITATLLLFQHRDVFSKKEILLQAICVAFVIFSLLILYPEISPFLVLGYILYIAISIVKGWRPTVKDFFFIALLLAVVILISNSYLLNYMYFLLNQAKAGIVLSKETNAIFPYFLIPSGIASLWGLHSIASLTSSVWSTVSFVLGILLILAITYFAFRMSWNLVRSALILLIMLGMSLFLFFKNDGFALFKVAMYMQPFIIATTIIGIYTLFNNNTSHLHRLWLVPIAIILVSNLITEGYYVQRSYGSPGAFVQIPYASRDALINQVENILAQNKDKQHVNITSSNVVIQKLLVQLMSDKDAIVSSRSYFMSMLTVPHVPEVLKLFRGKLYSEGKHIAQVIRRQYKQHSFEIFPQSRGKLLDTFTVTRFIGPKANTLYLFDSPLNSVLNRRHFQGGKYNHTNIVPLASDNTRNFLIFKNSQLGLDYYSGDFQHISLNSLQPDYFYPNSSITGLGRYLLFQVVNPTDEARLILNLTATLNPKRDTKLPNAIIIGKDREKLPIVGYGSARIVSAPIHAQDIAGRQYIMIDLGRVLKYKRHLEGVLNIYGKKVILDRRLISSYARDISLLSESQYQQMRAPSEISSFPKDLANPNLLYSGIYEDSWISNDSYLTLRNSPKKSIFIFKGVIPPAYTNPNYLTRLTISINGYAIVNRELKPGNFKIQKRLNVTGKDHIVINFSNMFSLPAGDKRLVSAKIEYLGFKSEKDQKAKPPTHSVKQEITSKARSLTVYIKRILAKLI